MNILVTGGAGFVGTNLIKRLLKEGHVVMSIDNYSTGSKSNHIDGCTYRDFDLCDRDDLNSVLKNLKNNFFSKWFNSYPLPDVVFHMAAVARIQPSFEDPEKYIDTNFNGTYKIVKLCVEKNIPLIYAGSSSHHSGKFKNPYTFSKDLGEEIIQLYQKHFNLNASVARFYNVYGPHQLTKGGYTTLIGRWINNIENGYECEIYGDGSKRRDFTHVDDIVDGLVRIMRQQAYGHIFELGREQNHSVNEVANMFNIDPIYKEDKPGEAQETLSDSTLAKDLLAWQPTINLQDYIDEILHTISR